ncbi:ABC transporter ATP-binding protein YtrB [Rosistilla carotiformis]|uniref:ABC transporter ATP-binding protein YtrB n=1 Tax=Rosistilla carotiformis TaxID=2528017 RepID=A0A518JW30_9BACT|nr:ATP-binding cassette domain-containing protein [Rosistilla carotiformis]QDV69747.1 ABC transporter ATP-binding protein YtrB [Rosistilla carotiformis]
MNASPSAGAAVEVHNLSRAFRGNEALRDVNLTIPTGSIFGLVGLNGAGKTILIRHLIGALVAKHGRVRVLGEDPVADPAGVLKRIGYLTEEDSLPQWLRVGDLIDFSRAIYPTWDDAYAAELGEVFALSRSSRLQSLSKGQRARAGLLVAIAHRPELLILDEPSSGLDPIARSDILEAIIRTVSEDGRTVLFSSHLLDEVARVCDSVALMSDGRIVETRTIEELQSRYCEIIFRGNADSAAQVPNAFGLQRSGGEWSAVVETEQFDASAIGSDLQLLNRREITLDRWFAARAKSTGGPPASDSSDGAPQVIAMGEVR